MRELISDKGVCRTASATLVLLTILKEIEEFCCENFLLRLPAIMVDPKEFLSVSYIHLLFYGMFTLL